jgi:hypothetical protein
MTITAESTSTRILLNLNGNNAPFILERLFYKDDSWKVYTESGFVIPEESTQPLELNSGDFVDSFELQNGLYQYRIHSASVENPELKDFAFTCWTKFGVPDAVGYSFNNYKVPEGEWGTVLTPDDIRYTYVWGTDFKSSQGNIFTDEQIQFFIDAGLAEIERMLNITIKKKRIKSTLSVDEKSLHKKADYDEEESLYDFKYSKIQRYGMIQTKQRPILKTSRCTLINRGANGEPDYVDLLPSITVDKKNGVIKFLKRPFKPNDTWKGICEAISPYGAETWNSHLFYAIDYEAGFESSDDIPDDLRQIIGELIAMAILNIIGDGLMSGLSSTSLSMDGVSESYSSTMSATSAYFGARLVEYRKDVEGYIEKNKYRFGFFRVGSL